MRTQLWSYFHSAISDFLAVGIIYFNTPDFFFGNGMVVFSTKHLQIQPHWGFPTPATGRKLLRMLDCMQRVPSK